LTGGAVPKEFDPGGRDPKALSARKIGNPLLSGYLQNLTASQTNEEASMSPIFRKRAMVR
jgi:hypothetical protein